MKKYLFGLFAITLAIASVAFTSKQTYTYTFEGDNDSEIKNGELWFKVAPSSECSVVMDPTICFVESTESDEEAFQDAVTLAEPDDKFELEAITELGIELGEDREVRP